MPYLYCNGFLQKARDLASFGAGEEICPTLFGDTDIEIIKVRIDDTEGWVRAPESYKNKATAIVDFEDSIRELVDALGQVTDERLRAPVETPFGALPLARLAEIVPRHIMYHSGQLNYIQTWLGDEVFHWA